MNSIIIIGRLVKAPDLRYTQTGTAVAGMTVAVDRKWKDGEERKADFFPVVVWSKPAENAAQYLDKGSKVAIQGRLETSNYQDKEGRTIYKTEIIAENVQYLDAKKEKTQSLESVAESFGASVVDFKDTDIPF